VDLLYDMGLGQVQEVVTPLEQVAMVAKLLTSKRRFIQWVLLNHRPHGAIQDQNT